MSKRFSISPLPHIKSKKRFLSIFSVRPHGNNLITGQTKRWITSVAIIIFMIALTEAIIWGNIFSFYYGNAMSFRERILWSCIVGICVFFIIWIIDTSFATLDMTRNPVEEDKGWHLPSTAELKKGFGL